jgi:hypothetical protein
MQLGLPDVQLVACRHANFALFFVDVMRSIRAEAAQLAPQLGGFGYVVVKEQIALVERRTRKDCGDRYDDRPETKPIGVRIHSAGMTRRQMSDWGSDSVIRRCLLNVQITLKSGRRADIGGCRIRAH